MDYREKAFKEKFNDAGKHLNVPANQVISLKLRDTVSSYGEYHDLLHILEHEAGLHCHEIDGKFQGHGYLIGDNKVKTIIVEHETGLEILYVAGSIASLVSLIPLILQCWSSIRGHGNHSRPRDFQSFEIRRLDKTGKLDENRSRGIVAPWSAPLSFINTALTSAAEIIDTEIKELRDEVKNLVSRVDSLEKKSSDISSKRKKSSTIATKKKKTTKKKT